MGRHIDHIEIFDTVDKGRVRFSNARGNLFPLYATQVAENPTVCLHFNC